MEKPGLVLLSGDEIGFFEIRPGEKIDITFHKGGSVQEMLEYATEQGLEFSLLLKPEALGGE